MQFSSLGSLKDGCQRPPPPPACIVVPVIQQDPPTPVPGGHSAGACRSPCSDPPTEPGNWPVSRVRFTKEIGNPCSGLARLDRDGGAL